MQHKPQSIVIPSENLLIISSTDIPLKCQYSLARNMFFDGYLTLILIATTSTRTDKTRDSKPKSM